MARYPRFHPVCTQPSGFAQLRRGRRLDVPHPTIVARHIDVLSALLRTLPQSLRASSLHRGSREKRVTALLAQTFLASPCEGRGTNACWWWGSIHNSPRPCTHLRHPTSPPSDPFLISARKKRSEKISKKVLTRKGKCAIMLITSVAGFFVMPCANPKREWAASAREGGTQRLPCNQIIKMGGAEKNG